MEYLIRAAELARSAFGHEHLWTARIYSDVALMYEEDGANQLASPWMRKSFTGCYKAVGIGHSITKEVYTNLVNIESNIGSPLMLVPIELMEIGRAHV